VAYLCFKRYEPQTMSPLIFLLVILPAVLSVVATSSSRSCVRAVVSTYTLYYSMLLFYTGFYRVSRLHPLSQYPGPFMAKISKFWLAFVVSQGKAHLYFKRLHAQYGDIVRVGPNELSIRDASVISELMGPNGLPKGPYWDNRSDPPSMIAQRDPALHASNRRSWARGFSITALKDYEVIITARVKQLVEKWEELIRTRPFGAKGTSIDISAWMTFFATDVLGDVAFGGGFELLRDEGDMNGICGIIESGNESQAIFSHIPWILPAVRKLPGWGSIIRRMRGFAATRVQERRMRGAAQRDLLYYLANEDSEKRGPCSPSALAADGLLAIVAGADTTATVLSALFYYLLRNPYALQRLRQEVQETFPDAEEPFHRVKLEQMAWLNSCLSETMRLQPPVPSGSQRYVPRGGGPIFVGKYSIPEETQLYVHTYSIHRDPRNFSDPDDFIPQRWLSEEYFSGHHRGRAHNPGAFIPFAYGPRACIGKQLAMMEMRMLVARVLQTFEFSADRILGTVLSTDVWEDTLQDWFVLGRGDLRVNISQL
ncbi:high nitrogen upregulated cytochrome P450 monooxygenase 2, partial [Vararia minispora EC-137]